MKPNKFQNYNQLPTEILESAMVSTQVSNNFIIHRSSSLKDTIQYLKVVTDHLISSHKEIKTQRHHNNDNNSEDGSLDDGQVRGKTNNQTKILFFD